MTNVTKCLIPYPLIRSSSNLQNECESKSQQWQCAANQGMRSWSSHCTSYYVVVANCPLSIITLILTKLFLIPSFLISTSKTSQDFHNRRFVLRYNYFILIMSKELPTHLISFNSKIKIVHKCLSALEVSLSQNNED